jgi:agmatine/peptidylarginine deiminase
MARRFRIAHSPTASRHWSVRPRVNLLEDRLPPGSMLGLWSASEPASDVAAAPPAAGTTARLALVAPPAAEPVMVVGAPARGEGAPVSRLVVSSKATAAPSPGQPVGIDPLASKPTFSADLGDQPGDQWLGLAKGAENHLTPPASRLVLPASAAGRGADGGGAITGSIPSLHPGSVSPAATGAASLNGTVAIPAGDISQLTGDGNPSASPMRVPPGVLGRPDPNQPQRPYSITYHGNTKDKPITGVVHSPAEYDPMRGVLYMWGSYTSIETAMIVALTADANHSDIAYVVVSSTSQMNSASSTLSGAGADMSKVKFIVQPVTAPGEESSYSPWMRDYGPHWITVDGAPAIVDSHYYGSRPSDNFIPTLLGQNYFNVPTYDMGLYYSGGNFQPGPNNSAFVTSLVTYLNTPADGFDTNYISELYHTYQGIDTLNIMPQLPFSVDSTGHIDMWMYLVDDHTVIISQFLPGSNSQAIQITNDAATYMQNLGFTVYRTPAWNQNGQTGTHYTYTNAFRVNDRIFVPVYGTNILPGGNSAYNTYDTQAMAAWTAAAGPNVQVIPIQCNGIISAAGAIHCIVMQVPLYTGSAPAVNVVSPAGGEYWLKGTQQTIRWSAMDTGNTDPASIDVYVSYNNGAVYRHLATTTDTGSFTWTVAGRETDNAIIKVVATSSDGDQTAAYSQPFHIRTGTQHVYDFSTGAGVDKFGYGYQTLSWTGSVDNNPQPVTNQLTSANYAALAASDNNRYIAPNPSSNNESTHVFTFTISEATNFINELDVHWEGYADWCTHVELYVWDNVTQQWSDGNGLSGQNRYMDDWAGNADGNLDGALRANFPRYIDQSGNLRLLVYADRPGNEPDSQHHAGGPIPTFHDYLSVTVKQV